MPVVLNQLQPAPATAVADHVRERLVHRDREIRCLLIVQAGRGRQPRHLAARSARLPTWITSASNRRFSASEPIRPSLPATPMITQRSAGDRVLRLVIGEMQEVGTPTTTPATPMPNGVSRGANANAPANPGNPHRHAEGTGQRPLRREPGWRSRQATAHHGCTNSTTDHSPSTAPLCAPRSIISTSRTRLRSPAGPGRPDVSTRHWMGNGPA